jgi:SAM-dependent methyltransferase
MNTLINPLQRWNERFSNSDYHFGVEPNDYLKQQISLLPKTNTLCIADGEGRNSVWLAKQGHSVTAFDFSPVAVDKAQKLANVHNVSVSFNCCSWENFDWQPSKYDVVVGIFFQFVPPTERDKLFKYLNNSLKKDGVLVIQGYGIDQLKYNTGGPGKLDHLYDENLLKNSFSNYKILDLRTYLYEINEGTAHNGTSSLVGMTAVKVTD